MPRPRNRLNWIYDGQHQESAVHAYILRIHGPIDSNHRPGNTSLIAGKRLTSA